MLSETGCTGDQFWRPDGLHFPNSLINEEQKDFPGGPGFKTLPPKAWGAGSTPGQGARIPPTHGQKTTA